MTQVHGTAGAQQNNLGQPLSLTQLYGNGSRQDALRMMQVRQLGQAAAAAAAAHLRQLMNLQLMVLACCCQLGSTCSGPCAAAVLCRLQQAATAVCSTDLRLPPVKLVLLVAFKQHC